MNYIVLDLEFNQAFPFKSGKKVEPNPECPFEIIQIGAVKLNERFEQLDSFNCMISPQIYPRLHPFVEKITGIRPKMLTGQPHFPEAYQAFLTFIGKEPAILCAWGGDDIKSLYRNILYYNLDADAMTNQFLNVQPFAAEYLHHETGKAIGLKNAVEALELPQEETFHNALNDATYTAKIFAITHPEHIQPDTFQPLTMLTKKPKRLRTNVKSLFLHIEERLERPLTEEEKALVKLAYMLGRNHTFDAAPAVRKKAGERLPIQRSPEIFRKPTKHPWFSSKKSVETSWSPLTPEHGFPSLFISARPKALPFCLPVSGCSFRMLSEIFIDILLFFQFFHLLLHIFALHEPTHHTDTCRTRFSDRCRIFAADAADGINRNGYAFHNLLQKRQPSGGKSLLAIRHENVSCCDIGTAKPSRLLCFRNRMAGCADASELFLFFFLHAAQNMQGQMDLLRSQ